jgi:hypothetical protein
VNGERVKEYVAADDRFGFGELMADDLARLLRYESELRRQTREVRAAFRAGSMNFLARPRPSTPTFGRLLRGCCSLWVSTSTTGESGA